MSRAINTITAATAADGATDLNIDSGTLFVNTTTNNVGIGTTAPATLLDVSRATDGVAIRISSKQDDAAHSTTTPYGSLEFYSVDGSVPGAGVKAAIRCYPHAASGGGGSQLAFTVSNGTTNDAEFMRINRDGNVGIGTASPTAQVTIGKVVNSATLPSTSANHSISLYPPTTSGYYGGGISWSEGANTAANICAVDDGASGALGLVLSTGNNSAITERLRITRGGEVYIAGTTDQGAYNLQVNGTGVWGAGAYVNGSDSRIKEDIQPITSGLDVVDKLNPVTYKYKETWSSDQSIQSGFIAQELLTALDGQIYVDGVVQQGGTDGYYSVAYQNLIPILAKAIQELKAENDSLKSRIEALEVA